MERFKMAEFLDEEDDEMQNVFETASDFVKKMRHLSDEKKLDFYGLFKQATAGECHTSRPGFWDMVGRAKWDAWKKHGDTPKEVAMRLYVQQLDEIEPQWESKQFDIIDDNAYKNDKAPREQTMGLAVSTLRGNVEDILLNDESKTIFDWCKEGVVKRMEVILTGEQVDINMKDEQGMALLHWACDRGHDHVVDHLITNKADVNIRDADGQTPLHYAATCEFIEIIVKLLMAGADASIPDDDGCLPVDSTDNANVQELLKSQTK